jgi:ParB family chromosome partitioning protein
MSRPARNIQLASVDDLFGLGGAETAAPDNKGTVTELPAGDLHGFRNHPFKVIPDDDAMLELIESIRENGILTPLEVRPRDDGGGYEVISGHRRKYAAMQAGLQTLPCLIVPVDDDTAIQHMVDSNLYRPEILPSEKAFAYKMKLDAMKRQAGRPDKNGGQVDHHLRGQKSRDILAEQTGESDKHISRYIRLTFLSLDLLDLVDAGKIKLNVGVTVSHLDEMPQIWLYEFIRDLSHSPTLEQAEKLKKYQGEHKLTKEVMEVIMTEETGAGPAISIKTKAIEKYFPPNTGRQEMEETILKLLDNWMNRRK